MNGVWSPMLLYPWIWKGVSATLQSGRYTLSYPMRQKCTPDYCSVTQRQTTVTQRFYNICAMLDQRRSRWVDVVQILYKFSANMRSWPNIDLLLEQRLRQIVNDKHRLYTCLKLGSLYISQYYYNIYCTPCKITKYAVSYYITSQHIDVL